jgi:L-threonylcarbamoyladenylate synthase
MLDQHYSPRTPLILRDAPFAAAELEAQPADVARVCFRRPAEAPSAAVYWLSDDGNPADAARRLFALLRELDSRGLVRIECERAPEAGLGAAINDRLRRAATRPA